MPANYTTNMRTIELVPINATIHFKITATTDQPIEINSVKYQISSTVSTVYLDVVPVYLINYFQQNGTYTNQWLLKDTKPDSVITVHINAATIETVVYPPLFSCSFSDFNLHKITTSFVEISSTNTFECPIPDMIIYILYSINRCDNSDQCSIINNIIPSNNIVLWQPIIISKVDIFMKYGAIHIMGKFDQSASKYLQYSVVFINQRTKQQSIVSWISECINHNGLTFDGESILGLYEIDVQIGDYFSVQVFQRVTYQNDIWDDSSNIIMAQYTGTMDKPNVWQISSFEHISNLTNRITLTNDNPTIYYELLSDFDQTVVINDIPFKLDAGQNGVAHLPYTNTSIIKYYYQNTIQQTSSIQLPWICADSHIMFHFLTSDPVNIRDIKPHFLCLYTDLSGTENRTSDVTEFNNQIINENINESTLDCSFPTNSDTHNYQLTYLFIGILKCRPYAKYEDTCMNDPYYYQYIIYADEPKLVYNLAQLMIPFNNNNKIYKNEPLKLSGNYDHSDFVQYYCRYLINNQYIELKRDEAHTVFSNNLLICNTTGILPLLSDGQKIDIELWQIITYQNRPTVLKCNTITYLYSVHTNESSSNSMISTSALIGISIGCIIAAILIVSSIIYCRRRSIKSFRTNRNRLLEDELVQ
jgi:hypothetical protein